MSASSPQQIHARIAQAFNDGDLDAFTDLYEEDATVVAPPEGTHVHGRTAIRAATEPIFALRPRAEITVVEKVANGSLALTHARWQVDGTDADGEPVHLSGRGTIVSRRQPEGGWRIVLDNPLSPD
jgi:uncharacterized protein (TIGR02246 family)